MDFTTNKEYKISQFADDTTLIANDIDSLSAAISIINSFSKISGLALNQKKTKALWIGSNKQNKNRPLGFECPSEPLRFLGTYLSHKDEENIKKNFSIKIQKMETKLNLWLTRDLTLFGRTMLAKSLGISQLIYSASMLSVLEPVINQTQGKLFAFLWRNKKDRIKRQALYQPLAKGGLSFPCFRTAVKALRLSWIGRILSDSNDNGRFQKISVPYHGRLFGIPKAREVLRTGNPKAWGDTYEWNSVGMGGFRSGIYTGDRQECIP